jgi:secretion/DNA translocation related TadE-like protein
MIITASVLSIIRAQHQAHNASDLAAISAASEAMESLDDTHCCAAARAIAQSNGAQLQRCEIVRAASEVAVEVEVTVAMGWKIPGVLEDITSTSYAGNQ